MGTAAYRRRDFLYLLLIGTQKRMLSICINRLNLAASRQVGRFANFTSER